MQDDLFWIMSGSRLDGRRHEKAAALLQGSQPSGKADAGKPSAAELLALAEKLCERTASQREADAEGDARRPQRGASVDMSVVMRRVAMARAEIADRDRLAKVACTSSLPGYLVITRPCLMTVLCLTLSACSCTAEVAYQ